MQIVQSGTRKISFRIAVIILVLAALTIGFIVAITILGAKEMAWNDYTQGNIGRLARFIEFYKEDKGKYPASPADLLRHPVLLTNSDLTTILSPQNNTQYFFEISSNGFTISAIKEGTLFSKTMKLSKHYEEGEVKK